MVKGVNVAGFFNILMIFLLISTGEAIGNGDTPKNKEEMKMYCSKFCWNFPPRKFAPEGTCIQKNGGEICNRACKAGRFALISGKCLKGAKSGKLRCFCQGMDSSCEKACSGAGF